MAKSKFNSVAEPVAACSVTQADVLQALREAGIADGDSILCHSSLSSFGKVDGGGDAVIDALLESVSPGGHVVMPSLTATYKGDPGPASGLVFDPAQTPSRVGKISDLFWRRPDAVRSRHPTHSLSCIGPRASEWMAGHDTSSTFSWDSAYAKFVRADGRPAKLVFLGVTMTSNTTLHAVEDWLDLPYMAQSTAVVANNGAPVEVPVLKAPHGCRGFYKATDRHHELMEKTGQIRRSICGAATISVIDARVCVTETIRQELASPGALLCLRSDCKFCTRARPRILPLQREIQARAREIRQRGLCN